MFEEIWNNLGSYIKLYIVRDLMVLCTYACICVEIDLNKDLPNKNILK
jgi:hypothetical protein